MAQHVTALGLLGGERGILFQRRLELHRELEVEIVQIFGYMRGLVLIFQGIRHCDREEEEYRVLS